MIDIGALVFVGIGAIHGLWRGLSGELAHVASLIGAFIFGVWFMRPFGEWLASDTRLPSAYVHAVAFGVTVFAALLILLCVRYLVRRIMKVVIEERFERVGGLITGAGRALCIVVILFVIMNLWPDEYLNRKFGTDSLVGTFIMRHIPIDITLPDAVRK